MQIHRTEEKRKEKLETERKRFSNSVEKFQSRAMDHMQTLNYDNSGDMWSESDASEYMQDQKYVEMDNTILKRLFQA